MANLLQIRPDPDPTWTFLWSLKKYVFRYLTVSNKPLTIEMMKKNFLNFLKSLKNSKDQEPDPVGQLNMDPPDPDVAFSHWIIPLMRLLRVLRISASS